MRQHPPSSGPLAHPRERGFSLIELLVAMVIALFVIGSAMGTMLTQKRNLDDRDRFATLQERQRLVATVLDNVVTAAGYFPDPVNLKVTDAFPAAGLFAAGQSLVGSDGASPTDSDSVTIRFLADNKTTDPVIGCNGDTNAGSTTASRMFENTLSVDPVTRTLNCTIGGTMATNSTPIVAGVDSMKILYGVDSNGDGSVDGYATWFQVGMQWDVVKTIQFTIRYANPLTGPGQPAVLTVRRTVPLMKNLS